MENMAQICQILKEKKNSKSLDFNDKIPVGSQEYTRNLVFFLL